MVTMLRLIPRHVPPLSMLMSDLSISPRELARSLHVSERSIYRWMSKDHAPRAVMLSLFLCSRWGVSMVSAESENAARMWAGFARCLMDERGMRVANIERPAANDAMDYSRKVVVGGRDGY